MARAASAASPRRRRGARPGRSGSQTAPALARDRTPLRRPPLAGAAQRREDQDRNRERQPKAAHAVAPGRHHQRQEREIAATSTCTVRCGAAAAPATGSVIPTKNKSIAARYSAVTQRAGAHSAAKRAARRGSLVPGARARRRAVEGVVVRRPEVRVLGERALGEAQRRCSEVRDRGALLAGVELRERRAAGRPDRPSRAHAR